MFDLKLYIVLLYDFSFILPPLGNFITFPSESPELGTSESLITQLFGAPALRGCSHYAGQIITGPEGRKRLGHSKSVLAIDLCEGRKDLKLS